MADLSDSPEFELYELDPQTPQEGRGLAGVMGSLAVMATLIDGPLIRLHSACTYGELLQTADCDCLAQLEEARRLITEEGSGILFYLGDQEGRGAGAVTKALAYKLNREEGLNTAQAYARLGVPFDQREYGHCVRFLDQQGISQVRLLSNNPLKIKALEAGGIEVIRMPHVVGVNDRNRSYLRTKRDDAGHLFPNDL